MISPGTQGFKSYTMNIPNILTFLRLLLIPVIVVVHYLPFQWTFIVSSSNFYGGVIYRLVDGYLARKLNQATPFGAFLIRWQIR